MISRLYRSLMFLSFTFWSVLCWSENVLIIHSYHDKLVWVQEINAGLGAELSGRVGLRFHYMDTKRIPPSEFSMASERALEVVDEAQANVVVICDDNALRLLGLQVSQRSPLVFCGINGAIRSNYPELAQSTQITGVLERPLIQRTAIEMNRSLGLESKSALVLLGNSTTAKAFYENDLHSKSRIQVNKNFALDVKQVATYAQFQELILSSKAEGFDFVLAAGFYAMRDDSDKKLDVAVLEQWLNERSPLPVFTVHGQSVGAGKLVGGMAIDGESMGHEAGLLVKQILDTGVLPRSIPFVTKNRGKFIFSRHELERWGLTLSPDYQNIAIMVP